MSSVVLHMDDGSDSQQLLIQQDKSRWMGWSVVYSICEFYVFELFIFFSNNLDNGTGTRTVSIHLSFGCWQLQVESTRYRFYQCCGLSFWYVSGSADPDH
jgi:hypothetical protein